VICLVLLFSHQRAWKWTQETWSNLLCHSNLWHLRSARLDTPRLDPTTLQLLSIQRKVPLYFQFRYGCLW